jgi:hypothetical protein
MQRIPLSHFVVIFCLHSLQQARSPLFKEAASKMFAINTMYYKRVSFALDVVVVAFMNTEEPLVPFPINYYPC